MVGAAAAALLATLAACSGVGEVASPASPAPAVTPAPVPPPPPIEEDAIVCPADVQLCPDGSWVARNPARRCAFDPCPGKR